MKGGCYNCAESLKFNYLGGPDAHFSLDWLGSDGAQLIFTSEDGAGRMFVNEESNYKVITSSIMIGAVANNDSLSLKPYLFSEFVNYFIGYNPVTKLQENIGKILSGKSYPNPFKGETKIRFEINRTGIVDIEIYNINGQKVISLVHGQYKPGQYKVTWDATDQSGRRVNNGYYICRITSGGSAISKKLILLR